MLLALVNATVLLHIVDLINSDVQQGTQKCDRFDLFTFFRTDFIQSEASWKLSSTSDWLMSAWKNVS